MATDLENLQTRKSAILAELAAIDTDAADGLPNSQASGVDHQGYKAGLYAELREIDAQMATSAGGDAGPSWQIDSQGFPG